MAKKIAEDKELAKKGMDEAEETKKAVVEEAEKSHVEDSEISQKIRERHANDDGDSIMTLKDYIEEQNEGA